MKIPSKDTIKYYLLYLGLILGAIGWGISFISSILSWETLMKILEYFSFPSLDYHPLLDYGLRLSTVIFGCIGILFLLCAIKINQYLNLIVKLGIFSIFIGTVSLVLVFQNNLLDTYGLIILGDGVFCLLVGGLILLSLKGSLSN